MSLIHTRPAVDAERYFTEAQAGELLNLGRSTLARWRMEGKGPPFAKFGEAVRYSASALYQWAEQQARQSTSE